MMGLFIRRGHPRYLVWSHAGARVCRRDHAGWARTSARAVGEEVQGWVADRFPRTYITGRNEQFVPRFDGLSSLRGRGRPGRLLDGLLRAQGDRQGPAWRERVLIHAATGGVGLAAIQVARALGAEVFATAGSPEKRDLICVVWESRTSCGLAEPGFRRSDSRMDQRHGVDVVLNSLDG